MAVTNCIFSEGRFPLAHLQKKTRLPMRIGSSHGVKRRSREKSSIITTKKDKHMENLLLIILIGLAGGIAVGLQSPLSSLMSQRIGTLESVFIVHIGGAIAALLPLLFYSGGKLSQWRTVPWYALAAGVFGLVVIGAVSYMIPRIGVAASITTIVAGQLLVGTILDHFGLLGAAEKSLDLTRILGLGVVLVGVWLTVK
jgi:transporter family-2 protein